MGDLPKTRRLRHARRAGAEVSQMPSMRVYLVVLGLITGFLRASDSPSVNAELFNQVPDRRHSAIRRLVITEQDGSPAISEKRSAYISELKSIHHDLLAAYYFHNHFPAEPGKAINVRAQQLAALHYPASATTGCSYHGALFQEYQIAMYEEEILVMAHAIHEELSSRETTANSSPKHKSLEEWLKAWKIADTVKYGPQEKSLTRFQAK